MTEHSSTKVGEVLELVSEIETELKLLGAALITNFGQVALDSPEIQIKCVKAIAKDPTRDDIKHCHKVCSAVHTNTENKKLIHICKKALENYTRHWISLRDVLGETEHSKLVKQLEEKNVFEKSLRSGSIGIIIAAVLSGDNRENVEALLAINPNGKSIKLKDLINHFDTDPSKRQSKIQKILESIYFALPHSEYVGAVTLGGYVIANFFAEICIFPFYLLGAQTQQDIILPPKLKFFLFSMFLQRPVRSILKSLTRWKRQKEINGAKFQLELEKQLELIASLQTQHM